MAQTNQAAGPLGVSLDGLLPAISSGGESFNFCQTVLEHCPHGVVITRGDRHVLEYVNDSFARLVGERREGLNGAPLADSALWLDATEIALLDRVYDTEHSESRMFETQRGFDGSSRTLRFTAWPLAEAGRRRGLVVTFEEMPDGVSLEKEISRRASALRGVNERLVIATLREHENADHARREAERLETLLANLSDGVMILEPSGAVHLMNAAAREIIGPAVRGCLSTTDLRGIELRDANGVAIADERRPAARALRGERFENEEIDLVRSAEEMRRILVSGTHVLDVDGSLALAMVIFRDVTELRRLEQMREEYASLISHDLRGPLSAVLSFAHLLQHTLESTDRPREACNAGRIIRNAQYMDSMIADLQDAARSDGDPGELRLVRCDVASVVSNHVERLGDALRGRIEIECDGMELCVLADPGRLERAINNLIGNALKYSPSTTRVQLRLRRAENDVQLDVIDQGVGVPPEDLTRIFDRYYRSSTGRSQRGLGLGLYIASLIVRAHGGRLRVQSTVGQGSTFSMSIPAIASS